MAKCRPIKRTVRTPSQSGFERQQRYENQASPLIKMCIFMYLTRDGVVGIVSLSTRLCRPDAFACDVRSPTIDSGKTATTGKKTAENRPVPSEKS